MVCFRVVVLSASGFAVLESEDAQPVKNEVTVFYGKEKAAVVVDTIASVAKPMYLAKPLITLKEGMVLLKKER